MSKEQMEMEKTLHEMHMVVDFWEQQGKFLAGLSKEALGSLIGAMCDVHEAFDKDFNTPEFLRQVTDVSDAVHSELGRIGEKQDD